MALIQGSFVRGISGRLGGTEFAMAGGQIIAKTAKPPSGKSTDAQAVARARIAETARSWAALPSQVRRGFVVAAGGRKYTDRLGDIRTLSGYQLYCQQQPDWTLIPGFPMPNPAPTGVAATPYAWSASFSASGSYFVSQTAVMDPYKYYWRILALARFVRRTDGSDARNWRVIGTFPWYTYGITITTYALAAGVRLQEGERVGVRMVPWGYGLAKGVPLVYTSVVAA